MPSIDSSSRLESETVSPATNNMLFMGQDTTASATTNDKEIVRNHHAPKGLQVA
jgi:hypothetical protein